MICEKCNQKKATVLYNENINGKARSFHLCGDCAAAMQASGELEELGSAFPGFASPLSALEDGFLGDLFGDLMGFPFTGATVSPQLTSARKCPQCGATLRDISSSGKVGCARCYQIFADELTPAIRSAHGKTVHTGRIPRAHRARKERQTRLAELKKQLKEAINTEHFEAAATLRDQIRAIEAEG